MRAASRLLAAVSQPSSSAARVLEPGTPTGLTGLLTHPAPRSTLLYLYSSTLSKLQRMPDSSVYRRATEALTKQRMAIIERVKPPGFDAWEDDMKFRVAEDVGRDDSEDLTFEDRLFVKAQMWRKPVDIRDTKAEWDGETIMAFTEGPLSQEERDAEVSKFDRKMDKDVSKRPVIDPEPLFTVEQ
jgi:NADH dehydrogenase (ubiquinone) 1 alpha subcomplex subunit 5